jgi:hypothetical protein
MDTVVAAPTIANIVQQEIEAYGQVATLGGQVVTISDTTQQLYGTVLLPDPSGAANVSLVELLAQVKDDKVIILTDRTDRPLYEALMINGGLRRDQIVLAYAGETLEQPTEQG